MTCNHIVKHAMCGAPAEGFISFSNDEGESATMAYCADHADALAKEAKAYEKRGLISLVTFVSLKAAS